MLLEASRQRNFVPRLKILVLGVSPSELPRIGDGRYSSPVMVELIDGELSYSKAGLFCLGLRFVELHASFVICPGAIGLLKHPGFPT